MRRREEIWAKYRRDEHYKAFKRERNRFNRMLLLKRSNSIGTRILQAKRDTKALHSIVNNELGTSKESPLPESLDDRDLANSFAEFFHSKIVKIRDVLTQTAPQTFEHNPTIPTVNSFHKMSTDDVQQIITSMTSKSCELDVIPTTVLKKLLQKLTPILTHIVNASLTQPDFPRDWKTAIVRPLLKKANLDKNIMKNYRPVSNLSFISKVVERCMLSQFNSHCAKNCLLPDFQSAYRKNYSTETSLVKLTNDILNSMESQKITMMAIMDLSAAFDTTDHDLFLKVMLHQFGYCDTALEWFANYLSPRGFKVCINESYSTEQSLEFSVPQGSCAAATLFTAYSSSIVSAIPSEIDLSGFADDHSIRRDYNPKTVGEEVRVNSQLSHALTDINFWMTRMRLKMNPDKTEYIQFGTKQTLAKATQNTIQCGEDSIEIASCVSYLGANLDSHLSFSVHITNKCKSALRNYARIKAIRKHLHRSSCETLVLALCISHLDYSNAILIGLPECQLKRLQRVQNMCAKLVLRWRKFDSATGALRELHWLPIKARLEFKIALLVYNCMIGEAPEYLKDLLHIKQRNHRLRSSADGLLLEVPKTKRKTLAERSFSVKGPQIWNSLPYTIRDCDSIELFKKKLKTHLFQLYLS